MIKVMSGADCWIACNALKCQDGGGSGEKMAKLDGHYRREKRANWLAFVVLKRCHDDRIRLKSRANHLQRANRRILKILFPSGQNSILGP